MADEEEDNTWVLDLEASLPEDITTKELLYEGEEFPEAIRAECWRSCLGLDEQNSRIRDFPEIFDLQEQEQLRSDCQAAVERLGNDEADKVSVVSDMESIVTCYCKTHGVSYTPGWVDLLLPILALKRPKADTYAIFEALLERLVPRHSDSLYNLLRLLILYHDPHLCSYFDKLRITPDMFARSWFTALFAGVCDLQVVHAIWDIYLQRNDPFLIFFLCLVILVNGREHILSLKNESKSKVIETISMMPSALEHNDVKDFCSLALYYILKTPKSFRVELEGTLFGRGSPHNNLSQALCLTVSANELVGSATDVDLDMEDGADSDRVRFFLVDCRPAEQYNAGHLSTAFHLDSNLMLQEPAAFNMAVQGLLTVQRQAIAANSQAGGNHLCFLGSGREEEDQYTHMVVASFLQKNILYVSMLAGGYEAIHDYFGPAMADCLEDHDDRQCLVCKDLQPSPPSTPATPAPTNHLLGKFSAALKTRSADLKEKLIEYIVNPTGGGSDAPRGKNKLYRGLQPVFSIDEDENGDDGLYEEDADEETGDRVSLSEFDNSPDTVAKWQCHQMTENGYTHVSHLVLTQSHLIVLRETSDGKATLVVKRPLTSINKITAKKRLPNLITFKYAGPDGNTCDMDRFLIPNASDVTAMVSKQVSNFPLLSEMSRLQPPR